MGKNIRVELIIPPNPYLEDDKRNPPLGMLYLAAVAEKEAEVKLTDLRGKRIDDFYTEIVEADIYGITASTPDYPLALEISEIAKSKNNKSRVVLGGVHATAVPETIDRKFDKVVIGEGERIFLKVLEDFCNGNDTERFYTSPPIEDLDRIPFPARHLLPFNSVFSRNAFSVGGDYAGTIITSRGCPNNCSFCASEKIWERRVRFRSADNVVGEIKNMIERYDIRNFRFQDDTMTLGRVRFEELCSKLSSLDIRWRATTRVDQADLERLKMMKRAGCEEVGYGIESLSQRVLDKNHKKIKMVEIYTALKNTREAGLKYRLFFIIGLPGETPGFSERLEEFIEQTNPDGVDLSTMVPYPGSDTFHHPERYGIKLKPYDFGVYHMTLGLMADEIERPLTFVHDVMTEEQIIEERRRSLKLIRERKLVKNF